MTGRIHWEDIEVGQVERFGRYEVSAEEIVEYARQFDPQPFHLDEEAGRHSIFGGLIASGWHTAAMLMRMICDHALGNAATVGAVGFDGLKWLTPVRPGDVLSVETRAVDKAPSRSRPELGSVKIENRVFNQHGVAVMMLTSIALYRRRPAR